MIIDVGKRDVVCAVSELTDGSMKLEDNPTWDLDITKNIDRFVARELSDDDAMPLIIPHLGHGTRVEAIDNLEKVKPRFLKCDGLISSTPGVLLSVNGADCFPVMFFAPVNRAVGIAHVGWRGAAAGLPAMVVSRMQKEYNCDPINIEVVIGPGIGKCCFEVGMDVVDRFPKHEDLFVLSARGSLTVAMNSKFMCDLRQIIVRDLIGQAHVGIIRTSGGCTMCEKSATKEDAPPLWHSRRRQLRTGKDDADHIAVIGLTK